VRQTQRRFSAHCAREEENQEPRLTHHQRVHDQVVVLEGIEHRRRDNPILTRLPELQGHQDYHLDPKHGVEVKLHGGKP